MMVLSSPLPACCHPRFRATEFLYVFVCGEGEGGVVGWSALAPDQHEESYKNAVVISEPVTLGLCGIGI